MVKQYKATKLENVGKGKVTPVQIAFIVDRYLANNNCTNILSAFRIEASDLFSKTKRKRGYLGIHSSGFRDFLLKPELLRAIVDYGFEHPSEGKHFILNSWFLHEE